jgi:undecaprenyl-diphosphatase
MPFITERNHWFIFYAIIWLYLIIKGGAKGRAAAVLILILIYASDQTSDNLIKPLVQRIRPCHVLQDVHLLVNCTHSFSFPSNHAVNNFAAAVLFSYFYPSMKYVLFGGAFIVSLSRVMCGVHYPGDIIGGAAIGILFAMILIFLWKKVNRKLKFV